MEAREYLIQLHNLCVSDFSRFTDKSGSTSSLCYIQPMFVVDGPNPEQLWLKSSNWRVWW